MSRESVKRAPDNSLLDLPPEEFKALKRRIQGAAHRDWVGAKTVTEPRVRRKRRAAKPHA